jgi:hypothetical protein
MPIGYKVSQSPAKNISINSFQWRVMKLYFVLICLISFFCSSYAFAGEGHDAGRNWAEEREVDDPDECYNSSGGSINNSASFTEGCLEYMEENKDNDAEEEEEE